MLHIFLCIIYCKRFQFLLICEGLKKKAATFSHFLEVCKDGYKRKPCSLVFSNGAIPPSKVKPGCVQDRLFPLPG